MMLSRRRERVAHPFPGLALIGRGGLAFDDRQGALDVRPVAERLAPKHELGPCVEDAQQIP